jgi:NTP pyrophosphatase (non-canonical NTP hydrolase)
MSQFKDLQREAYTTAVEHGWWEDERNMLELICLMHSELGEATEAWREDGTLTFLDDKPRGLGVEFADCIIRIMDTCERHGIDLEACIVEKMKYNKTRPYRHGGKKA